MKITLEAWAERNFDPAPTLPTLRTWARQKRIQPEPVKVGRTWYVEESARYDANPATPAAVQIGGMSERAAGIFRAAA